MKLSELAQKPVLVEVSLDDEDTIKEFNEPLTFYTWDRQPMDVFLKLANVEDQNNSNVVSLIKTMILDENGVEILTGDKTLPAKVLMRAITKITELLGK